MHDVTHLATITNQSAIKTAEGYGDIKSKVCWDVLQWAVFVTKPLGRPSATSFLRYNSKNEDKGKIETACSADIYQFGKTAHVCGYF